MFLSNNYEVYMYKIRYKSNPIIHILRLFCQGVDYWVALYMASAIIKEQGRVYSLIKTLPY